MSDSVRDFVMWLGTLTDEVCSPETMKMVSNLASIFLDELDEARRECGI